MVIIYQCTLIFLFYAECLHYIYIYIYIYIYLVAMGSHFGLIVSSKSINIILHAITQ